MRKRFLLPLIVFVGVAIGFFAVRSIEIARRENANEAIVVQNSAVAHYFATSEERIKRAVVTLPEGDTIVGLHNGTATYPYTMVAPKKVMSTVTIGSILGRKLIPSSTLDTPARLDVFATMTVSNDAYGGSLYVVLFRDRGDAALERSYVRVGDPKTFNSIQLMAKKKSRRRELLFLSSTVSSAPRARFAPRLFLECVFSSTCKEDSE